MDLKHIIDQKDHYADYMVDEITHICRDFEKREPGSKGEQQACEYMAQVLKKDCGCQRASNRLSSGRCQSRPRLRSRTWASQSASRYRLATLKPRSPL